MYGFEKIKTINTAGDIMKKLICALLCILTIFNIYVYADSIYDENGYLIYFEGPYLGSDSLCIPDITRQQARSIAQDFINNNCYEVISEISTENIIISYSKSIPYGYNITFPRVINNIEYPDDSVSLFIDSKNGQVTSYVKNFSDDITVEPYSSVIDKKTAEHIYQKAVGLNLQYYKKIENNKINVYLTYTADDIIVNAVTGNTIPTEYYISTDGYFDVVNTAEKVSEYVDDGTAISIAEADSKIRSISELEVTDDYSIISVDYLKNHDNTYLITLLYKSGIYSKEITLNAKTGILAEYSDNSDGFSNNPQLNSSAESFAEKYYSDYSESVIKRKTSGDGYDIILYERLVNGIPYKSNGIYVSYYNGKLKQVSVAWDNIEFPTTEDIASSDYAYGQFFNRCGLELSYYRRDNGVITPVYRKSSDGTGIFDARSCRQLNYDGSYYYSIKDMNYVDKNTHYAGDFAEKLADCDIYVSSGEIFLEDYITQQEYLLLISEFISGTKPVLNTTGILTDAQREMLYAYMYSNNIMDRQETDYTGYITRADAIKYFMRILGHGTIGDMNEIFIRHFADSDEIPEKLVGYVELARSLGIVNGSTDNRFKPNDFLTKGDSLIIVYNYLVKQG